MTRQFIDPSVTTERIQGVAVDIDDDKKTATITDLFRTWDIPDTGSSASDYINKRLDEMSDDEILDALVIASRVGDALEAQGYEVGR